jgi:hypothetical protein
MARSQRPPTVAQQRRRNAQRIAARRARLAGSQAQRSAERQRQHLEAEATRDRLRQVAASAKRRAARERRPSGSYRISAPFYARKSPDGYPRQFGARSRVWADQRTASVIGEYNNAVKAAENGDYAALDEFIDRVITDQDGNSYRLVTDHAEINAFLRAGRRNEYHKSYRVEAV